MLILQSLLISRWDYIKIDPPPEVHLCALSLY